MEHDVQMCVNICEFDQLISNLVTRMRMLSYVYVITTFSQFFVLQNIKVKIETELLFMNTDILL